MALLLRNEVEIELAGQKRVMRASFKALQNIEADLRRSIISIIQTISGGDISFTDAAVIVHHGLNGYGDTRLTFEEVGEAIVERGIDPVSEPVVVFLSKALKGVELGKPEPETAKAA